MSSADAIDHGRFSPGTLLGGRYRIVGKLGRGGMGEVYRADDLKLGQPVALKFLPAEVDRDPARLTQLHTEVRMARQVSHPNVCRVYDIDEIEGQTFLSMEYIDGEDLATLLKRVGRFPEERALDIARQICAGLAAAHERGVVHRDLKPANVMLDGGGKVRVTDFGLAGATGEIIRAGTPAYMAPEQLAGGEVTARSDIYALGLVLYEIFTGQRGLEGKNLAELIHKREQAGIVPPSVVVRNLSPEIDRAIMSCLQPAPEMRPASALLVSSALPGGDPLAAALALGQTPSPEMVANATSSDAMSPGLGITLLSLIAIGLVIYGGLLDRRLLVSHVWFTKSFDVLEDRARELTARLGYRSVASEATGLAPNGSVLSYISTTNRDHNRWSLLANGDYPALVFWYRSSPVRLVPQTTIWAATPDDPPLTTPGMSYVRLDQQGRLLSFSAVPPRRSSVGASQGETDWRPLFDAAGLTFASFAPAAPSLVPSIYADERLAWEGPHPTLRGITLRVEAAAFERRPVSFDVSGPWIQPQTSTPAVATTRWSRTVSALAFVMFAAMLIGSLLLARRSLAGGRADVRGATKVALLLIGVWVVAWAIGAPHYTDANLEGARFREFLGTIGTSTGTLWLAYIALEPYVRRLHPVVLISWTRLLAGRLRDPLVGRDLLIGMTVGVAVALIGFSFAFLPQWFGNPPGQPRSGGLLMLLSGRETVSRILRFVPNSLQNAMLLSFVFVIARAAVKRTFAAVLICSAVLGLFIVAESGADSPIFVTLFAALFAVPLVLTLRFFGALATTAAFLVNQTINSSPLTTDVSKPYIATSLWIMVLILSVAAFAYYAARGGKPLFGRILAE